MSKLQSLPAAVELSDAGGVSSGGEMAAEIKHDGSWERERHEAGERNSEAVRQLPAVFGFFRSDRRSRQSACPRIGDVLLLDGQLIGGPVTRFQSTTSDCTVVDASSVTVEDFRSYPVPTARAVDAAIWMPN